MLGFSSASYRFLSTSAVLYKYQRLPRHVTFVRPDAVVIDEQFRKRVHKGKARILKHPGTILKIANLLVRIQ